MKKTLLALFTLCVITNMSMGQSWQYAGPKESYSTNSQYGMDFAFSPSGVPFMAFSDDQNDSKATVMSFSGSNWNVVGSAGFSAGNTQNIKIAFSPSGIPYVTFIDADNNSNISVMRFSNGNWTYVGIAGFSPGSPALIGNIIFNSSGTPFMSYMNFSEQVTVMSFDGANWGTAGNSNFVRSFSCDLVLGPSGNLYMAVSDYSNGSRVSLLSFTGSNWSVVGTALFSPGYSQDVKLAFNPEGVPFVVFQDWANNERATVMSLSGSNWSIVGTAGFLLSTVSGHKVQSTCIAFSPSGTLYLAYTDLDVNLIQGPTYIGYLNNGNWILSGIAGLSTYVQKLTFSPGGVPYIGIVDDETFISKVMSFSGANWEQVGPKPIVGFSDGDIFSPSLAFNHSGTPYVAYRDDENNSKVTVKSFDGSNWNTVGNEGFSAGKADYISLIINPSGIPYVAFEDHANNIKATVMSFDGTNWGNVGSAGFSTGAIYSTSLAFSPSGILCLAFLDGTDGTNGEASVMSFDGSNWGNIGNAGFSSIQTGSVDLTFNPGGVPYVSFLDYSNDYNATVMSFNGSNWGNVGSTDFSPNFSFGLVIAMSPSSVPYVAFTDQATGSFSVMSFDGSNWSIAGTASLTGTGVNYISLAFNASGVPYVAYDDDTKATVRYLSNGNWSVAGTAGFSQGTVQYINLAFNPTNDMPFVVYEGFSGGAVAQYLDKDSQTIPGLLVSNVSLSGTNVVLTLPEMASSGLPVTYSIVSTPSDIATINGNLLTVSDVGTVTVTATQIGNAAYKAAVPVSIAFTVSSISGITSTITGPVTIVSSINNQDDVSAVKLYPNPAKGILNIAGINAYSTIELLNSLGSTVYQQKADTDFSVDISNYSPGLYLIKVTSGTRSKIFRVEKE